MNIRWTQPTLSGLCDRLTDILLLAAYARLRNAKILIDWPVFSAKDIDIAHRKTDILLENVLKYISFPAEIVFDVNSPAEEAFSVYMGGGSSISQFYLAHAKEKCTAEEFAALTAAVAKDFVFCDSIKAFLETLPKKFVAFHIRRGDKIRNEPSDGNFTNISELDWLNSATYRAVDYYIGLGYDTFFICGDEDHKIAPFVDYVQTTKNKSIIKIPEMPKWESTYYDMAVMTKSDQNIASQKFSSFSYFPALLSGGLFRTVFNLSATGLI